jgi:ATP-dependent helicase/nuclease subunit A
LQAVTTLSLLEDIEQDTQLRDRLEWQYPHMAASALAAKTSVTEMKRLHEDVIEDAIPMEDPLQTEARAAAQYTIAPSASYTFRMRRPAFMEEKSLTAAEKGSVNHLLMQHVTLTEAADEAKLKLTLESMIERRLLTAKQSEAIDLTAVAAFFRSELGQRLLGSHWVRREVPFSCMFPASRVYPESDDSLAAEPILIQGVIDCLFEDAEGVVLLDYKTDRIINTQWKEAAERHRFQLELYAEAIESVLGRKVNECYVFFFDGGQSVLL